jgi:hypothetical protein
MRRNQKNVSTLGINLWTARPLASMALMLDDKMIFSMASRFASPPVDVDVQLGRTASTGDLFGAARNSSKASAQAAVMVAIQSRVMFEGVV